MLALARSEGQSIIIDGQIEVKVVKWSRSSVRLAIQAPRAVTVDRDEIWRKMHPGELTPLEVAEKERNERFAREGVPIRKKHGAEGDHGSAATGEAGGNSGAVERLVVAPVAGVFRGAAGSGGAAGVQVGSAVEVETVVGSIVAGDGVVTEVRAGMKGMVVRVLAGNGQRVAEGEGVVGVRG